MSNQPPPDPYGQGSQPEPPQYPSQGQQYPPPPGQPPPGYPPQYSAPPAGNATNTMAIVSLVCALAGLIVYISAPVGAILGHVARKQIRERGEQGEGLALTGIIVGWVITGLGVLACCGVIALIMLAESA